MTEDEILDQLEMSIRNQEYERFLALSEVLNRDRIAAGADYRQRLRTRQKSIALLSLLGPDAGQIVSAGLSHRHTGLDRNPDQKFRVERLVLEGLDQDQVDDMAKVLKIWRPRELWRILHFTNETVFELVRE